MTTRFKENLKMPNLESLTLSDSRVSKYGCLHPWEREDKSKEIPLEEQPRVYIEEIPEDEYVRREPEKTYDRYEPKRGVVIIQY